MTRRIAVVDMLRGIAAAVVVFHHSFTHFPATFRAVGNPTAYWICDRISELNVEAVMLFFVVSGFSIRLSVERIDLQQRTGLNEYIYRRLKRILPLYLFALAFAALCVMAFDTPTPAGALSPWTLLGNLAFLQTPASVRGGWVMPYADNGPLWSLSFEMFYYLLFPIHHARVSNSTARFATAWLVSAVGVALNVALPNPIAQFAANYAIWYCGVELARMYLTRSAGPVLICGLLWAALLALGMRHTSATLHTWRVGLTFFLIGSGVLRLRLARTSTETAERPWLTALWKPLTWIGSFSYALYLLHFPIIAGLSRMLGDTPVALGLALSLSLVVALSAERLSMRPQYAFLKVSFV